MSYPVLADLQSFLTAGGVAFGDTDLASALSGAVTEFESRTGWSPFVREATDGTQHSDPPTSGTYGCVLDLESPILSLTSLSCGVGEDGTGGTAMVQGTDFVLLPYGGGTDRKPWTQVRFSSAPYGGARSIKVVGKRGYSSVCPDDVRQAILRKAAASIIQDLAAGQAGDATEISQGPVTYRYDATAGRGTVDRYANDFEQTVRRYRRW